MNKPQASHTAARLQEGVGWGTPGNLTDATQVSLFLLRVLLQETKRKTSPGDQGSAQFLQTTTTNTTSQDVKGRGPTRAPQAPPRLPPTLLKIPPGDG